MYDGATLRAGTAKLGAIEEAELGPVDGFRVIHLQCHFGRDSLILAQRGASVVGLDFSSPAITAAKSLADELGLAVRARFVEADLYNAPAAIPEPASFDRAYVTWGALCWLPDIGGWARIVAQFLKPGGALYLAEGHPAALVMDDAAAQADGRPGYFVPYFHADQPDHPRVDPSVGFRCQRADRVWTSARLAARARRRSVAHVPLPDPGRRWALPVA
jgi:SAM-dependent methyltransferase